MRYSTVIMVGLALLIVLAACGQPSATPTPAPPPGGAATQVPTAGDLAALGKTVYDAKCGMCHASGAGPAIPVWIQTFPTAQGILDYASRNMPKSSPGSLKREEYFQIVAWVLVDQKVVTADAVLDINKLADVATKK